jgi:hypothetical protein
VPAPGTGYTCNCTSGWEGTDCDQDIDGCATNACVNGSCEDVAAPGTGYTCNCDPGYDGTLCDQDEDGCAGNQCANGSTCVDNVAPAIGYTCDCLSGWEGALCQNDIDGCVGNSCVAGHGTCVDVVAPGTGYTCNCSSGWEGTYCETDINGCANPQPPCDEHATCSDVAAPGTGYTCDCDTGYEGDGFTCTPICVDMPVLNQPYTVAANGCLTVSPTQGSTLQVQIHDRPGDPDVNVPYTWTDNCSGSGSGTWTTNWQAVDIYSSFPGCNPVTIDLDDGLGTENVTFQWWFSS